VLQCAIPLKAEKSAFQQPKSVLIGIEDSLARISHTGSDFRAVAMRPMAERPE
jgi:hypothetical protein